MRLACRYWGLVARRGQDGRTECLEVNPAVSSFFFLIFWFGFSKTTVPVNHHGGLGTTLFINKV